MEIFLLLLCWTVCQGDKRQERAQWKETQRLDFRSLRRRLGEILQIDA